MAFLAWWKNRVFSGETMVLGYHMLHLNAARQLWRLSVPGCGPAPRRSLPLVGKCFQWEQEEATFHGATSRCRTQKIRWGHLCVWACVHLFFHVCAITVSHCRQAQSMSISLMKQVKRSAFLQVENWFTVNWQLEVFNSCWLKFVRNSAYFSDTLLCLCLHINNF